MSSDRGNPFMNIAQMKRYKRIDPDSSSDAHPARNLLLFLDGTGKTFDSEISNVVKLSSLANQDPEGQLVYYQSGIGVDYGPWSVFQRARELLDSAFAFSLSTHVQDAYKWLMNHWKPGDRIYIFGFSRGAFTGRALAGMLQQVGLLPAGNEESVAMAYSVYSRKADTVLVPGKETLAQGFKRTFSRDVYVHFVGVWDTVSSVGALVPRTLPFSQGSKYIRNFRQALALDERRARYAEQPYIFDNTEPPFSEAMGSYFAVPTATCSVKEVWFAGSHSNVGGGVFPYDGDVSPALSNLSLKWMLREAVQAGLQLDHHALSTSPIFSPFYTSAQRLLDRIQSGNTTEDDEAVVQFIESCRSKSKDIDELACGVVAIAAKPGLLATADALALRSDRLSLSIQASNTKGKGLTTKIKALIERITQRLVALGWWTLELSPTIKVTWDVDGATRRWRFAANRGRGRILPPNASLHYSVKTRLDAAKGDFSRYGNDENVPEGNAYESLIRFRPGQSLAGVKFVE
ncbi:T6SS phospholipase effector Tle1-like catalytic domain-containing protein [Sporobolomyces salmoneus]|uniref:T6SS phospholipase effector Tle1-like catalytic domain-containing protein n=1 Tax=Sporobolomyces salmoneus TaxID=183962 RepID=UPI003170A2DB